MTVDAERLQVLDEGPGVPTDALPKLFERFWRGSARQNEGAGLGLSICSEIAAAHAWHLSAGNTGRGAEFTIDFVRSNDKSTVSAERFSK